MISSIDDIKVDTDIKIVKMSQVLADTLELPQEDLEDLLSEDTNNLLAEAFQDGLPLPIKGQYLQSIVQYCEHFKFAKFKCDIK